MPSTKSWQEARAANRFRTCDASGCQKARQGVSRYCQAHASAFRRHGHPEQKPIYPGQYAAAKADVQALFKANPIARPIRAAEELISGALTAASYSHGQFRAWLRLARLPGTGGISENTRRGVLNRLASMMEAAYARWQEDAELPRRILVELCAIYWYRECCPRAFKSDRVMTYALAKAFWHACGLKLRSTHRGILSSGPAKAAMGGWIERTLGVFLESAAAGVRRRQRMSYLTRVELSMAIEPEGPSSPQTAPSDA